MKSRRLLQATLVSNLIAAGAAVSARAANPDQSAVRAKAAAELAAVTVDSDQANISFSPADDSDGANFVQVVQYQQEYMAGRQSFQDGKYGAELQHLRKADEIISNRPDWTESK